MKLLILAAAILMAAATLAYLRRAPAFTADEYCALMEGDDGMECCA